MSKEKQIEEMARIAYPGIDDLKTVFSNINHAQPLVNLYNAGYRKQSEGEWEVFGIANPKCSLCRSYNIEKARFCPHCGAHMR